MFSMLNDEELCLHYNFIMFMELVVWEIPAGSETSSVRLRIQLYTDVESTLFSVNIVFMVSTLASDSEGPGFDSWFGVIIISI